MSVDKFGRSNASIVRRSVPPTPSRRVLQSVGVLCKTNNFVDFKNAFARNIASPSQPTDATTKDYVDKKMISYTQGLKILVDSTVKQHVDDNRETIVETLHELTKGYIEKRLESFNVATRVYVGQIVQQRVTENLVQVVQELNATKSLLQLYKSNAKSDFDTAINEAVKVSNELRRLEDAVATIMDRVRDMEQRTGKPRQKNK